LQTLRFPVTPRTRDLRSFKATDLQLLLLVQWYTLNFDFHPVNTSASKNAAPCLTIIDIMKRDCIDRMRDPSVITGKEMVVAMKNSNDSHPLAANHDKCKEMA